MPEDIFVSKPLALALLAGHLGTLAYFCVQWLRVANAQRPKDSTTRLSPYYICYTLFVTNFVGIAFARTLHYQFYAWYISSIPFLMWSGFYPMALRVLLLAGLEFAFLTFPATPTSSLVLQLTHIAVLLQIRAPKQIWEQGMQAVEEVTASDDKKSR